MRIVEQLAGYHFDERWLLDVHGAARCLWVITELRSDESTLRGWLGEIHPRVSTIFSVSVLYSIKQYSRALLVHVEDDRGPTLVEAAAQLTDPLERERWVVSQIIALAEGLDTLRKRDKGYVYPTIYPERIFIDETGRARLRFPPPNERGSAPPPSLTGGSDHNRVRFLAPEQLETRVFEPVSLTPATEVFALAVNLYTAIAGRRPFAMEASTAEMMRILQGPYDPIELYTPNLGSVIDRALGKGPSWRFRGPFALARELRATLPDADDYDAVISDRIAIWRATLPPEVDTSAQISREELERVLG